MHEARPSPGFPSFPIPECPPQHTVPRSSPRWALSLAVCPSVRPATSVCRPLSQNPIVPNSSVCFVLPCYYAVLARVAGLCDPLAIHDPSRKKIVGPDLENRALRHLRLDIDAGPTASSILIHFNALAFTTVSRTNSCLQK